MRRQEMTRGAAWTRNTAGAARDLAFGTVYFAALAWLLLTRPSHDGVVNPRTHFTLVLRSEDPVARAPQALKHYAACGQVGAIRLMRDASATWNLTRAYHATASLRDDSGRDDKLGYSYVALVDALESAAAPRRVFDLMQQQRPDPASEGAVMLVSDGAIISCEDVARAFTTWQNRTDAIVGTSALGHVQLSDLAQDYTATAGTDQDGHYSMVSLEGALLHTKYLLQSAHDPEFGRGCDEVWLNQLTAAVTQNPPIYIPACLGSGSLHSQTFTSRSSVYYSEMTRCLNAVAMRQKSGQLDLVWSTSAAAAAPPVGRHKNASCHHASSVHPRSRFAIVDDHTGTRRKYLVSNDRVAGVTAVIVMQTTPNEVASAVHHLRNDYSFIREAVVWNNRNETMNHHMFPYDLPLRYVMAPTNHSAYSRYLGCLFARYDICYFQHELTRPLFLSGLYAAFLMRPDVIVAGASPKDAWMARTNLTIVDRGSGRSMGFADMDQGAFVHKDLVRQFVDRFSSFNSHSFYDRAANADIFFAFSQLEPPMVLTHTTWTNHKPTPMPTARKLGKALEFAFAFGAGKADAVVLKDPTSKRHKFFKSPCAAGLSCAFSSSINAWPSPLVVDFGQGGAASKSAHYYESRLKTQMTPSAQAPLSIGSDINYYSAVDGDLSTSWHAQLPSVPSFISLELLAPTIITGVKVWSKDRFEPIPSLQLGFYGELDYLAAWCRPKWEKDGGLSLLHYMCPPLRVHRVRLVIDALNQRLDIAEFAIEKLASELIGDVREFFAAKTEAGAIKRTKVTPPDIGNVVYVVQGIGSDFYRGDKLAVLEEACELASLYPGKVKLLYVGESADISIKTLARAFAVTGSDCKFGKLVSFETVPLQGAWSWSDRLSDHAPSHTRLGTRRFDVYQWWYKRNMDAGVVFYDPHESAFTLVLRNKLDTSPDTIFVARATTFTGGEAFALADATTVASASEYALQAQGITDDRDQDRRIVYPLRTLRSRHVEHVDTPSTPAVEEVVLLITPGTTPADMILFNEHAASIIGWHADIRVFNITKRYGSGADETISRTGRGKAWTTLDGVMHYASIYPARVVWVLDASYGAAYFASHATLRSARFVAAPSAIPHWESRLTYWNATCDWTPEGFAAKASELMQGSYAASSNFTDLRVLNHAAASARVEEWPIKRTMLPVTNTVANLTRYILELVSARKTRARFSREVARA